MRVSLGLACILLAYGMVEGREMPQGMIDEMMASFYGMVDKQFGQAQEMIQASLTTSETSSTKDLKQLMKDIKGDMGLSSAAALVGQFTSQVGLFINQYPNGITDWLTPLIDFHSKTLEQLEKLPPFAMKDARAPAIKSGFKDKFMGYFGILSGKVMASSETYFKGVAEYKAQMAGLLQKSQGGRGIDELNSKWDSDLKMARDTVNEKLSQFKENFFSSYH